MHSTQTQRHTQDEHTWLWVESHSTLLLRAGCFLITATKQACGERPKKLLISRKGSNLLITRVTINTHTRARAQAGKLIHMHTNKESSKLAISTKKHIDRAMNSVSVDYFLLAVTSPSWLVYTGQKQLNRRSPYPIVP